VSGTLYGLGIGPGDPNLITLKARDILQAVPVIAYPAPEGGESLVRAIADRHIPPGRTEIPVVTPMVAERFPAADVYDRHAREIARHLDEDRDVAVLCEGDPFLYGSFMYLFERLSGRYSTQVVPGVSSLAAVAAVAGRPLASRNEILTILPAPLPEAVLEAQLAACDAAAIMKVGRHLPRIRCVLQRLGLEGDAVYVERATMARERVLPLTQVGDGEAPYFSMVLVRASAGTGRQSAAVPVHSHVVFVALSQVGLALARRLQGLLPGSAVHGLAQRAEPADETFGETVAHLRRLFAAGRPIVGICAAGILIRAVAPLLADKREEPPVVALAEDGSTAVPLLGGHRGANRLARAIARATGGMAAITTAGDVRLGLGLDDPPAGWHVANPDAARGVTAALLSGEPVALAVEAGDGAWLTRSGATFADLGRFAVRVTDRLDRGSAETLVLHPPVLAVGVGCERGAPPDEVVGLVLETLARHNLSPAAVTCVVSLDLKADEPAVHAVAAALSVPARFFSAAQLEAETPRLANPSDIVFREVGCHGVAEGAALAAVGSGGRLAVAKTKSARATCAIARAADGIDPWRVGRPRGRLAIVGIGPGARTWRTAEATRALTGATDVVGLDLYLDLVADLIDGATRHSRAMTEEDARVRLALDLAAAGGQVVLLGSGDAGIYGLATLAFELMDRENRDDWNRIEVAVAPGVTALQAAAARVGAPINHDFCAISLSDLLTPWTDIERRLRAAAEADFVVALYNPVSRKRRTQLEVAREILLAHRPPATPVVLGRNLGREGEVVQIIRLEELHADRADMLTVVLVGSSQTRAFETGGRAWIYTPRGYDRKQALGDAAS
jgi:cobalt-precorrin 5A hydrolase/precorrin-3B C17-methyltransferase